MHDPHRKAAGQHELAARSHRTVAEHLEKGDFTAAIWYSERALDYSNRAYNLAQGARPGEIESL